MRSRLTGGRGMPDRRVQVRVPSSLHQRLHEVADRHVVSVNWIINRAVVEYLDRLQALPAVVVRDGGSVVWSFPLTVFGPDGRYE